MREIHIPIEEYDDNEIIEITVSTKGKKNVKKYRIETIICSSDKEGFMKSSLLTRVDFIKRHLENSDKNWDLLQIFSDSNETDKIRVLLKKITSVREKMR
jgi:hypothetical protein